VDRVDEVTEVALACLRPSHPLHSAATVATTSAHGRDIKANYPSLGCEIPRIREAERFYIPTLDGASATIILLSTS
jgi:hypothetical protein